jgi:hypothetical protein
MMARSRPLRVGAGWGSERRFRGLIDDVRAHTYSEPEEISALAQGINQIAEKRPLSAIRSSNSLRWYFLETGPGWLRALGRLTALRQEREKLNARPTVMVMASGLSQGHLPPDSRRL